MDTWDLANLLKNSDYTDSLSNENYLKNTISLFDTVIKHARYGFEDEEENSLGFSTEEKLKFLLKKIDITEKELDEHMNSIFETKEEYDNFMKEEDVNL